MELHTSKFNTHVYVGGVDYEEVTKSITIPSDAGVVSDDTRFCTNITIIGDDQRENNEEFSVVYTSMIPDVFVGDVATQSVTITIMGDSDGERNRHDVIMM